MRLPRIITPAVLLATLLACSMWSSAATAAPALNFTSFAAGGFNADGSPSTQAGAHPWELITSFVLGAVLDPRVGYDVPAASLKDSAVVIPAGVIGDPGAAPQCSQFDKNALNCPVGTQVGYADLDLQFVFGRQPQRVPVYNMVPPSGQPAQFAFSVGPVSSRIDVKVRTDGDYGVTATVHNANAGAPVYAATVHLWGVPADSSHDELRFGASNLPAPGPSHQPRKPFLRNPTSCTGPVTTIIEATSWQEPDQIVSESAGAPGLTGCESVPFSPSLSLTPDARRAGSPAGLAVDLDLPQNDNPDGLATADLRKAVVVLPEGVSVNPSAANGLAACSDAQFGARSEVEDSCPDDSVIGSTKVTTPLLDDPLEGRIYIGEPHDQSASGAAAGEMFRVFMEAHGRGVRIKLAGSVVPDPETGQLTATFDNNPQLPFSNFHAQFDGGPSATLALPKQCGTYTTRSELTSWATNTPVESDSSFTIDQGCDQAGSFAPTLDAGLMNPLAGRSSPFTATFTRPDGQQDMQSVEVELPEGVLGKVGRVPLCPDAQAAAGTCGPGSQIGRATVAAGAGSNPFWAPEAGKTPTAVYLAGPYKGAPYSLSVVVPAQAGPFDLGTIVVRSALHVDPVDGHVTVKSDPLPTILLGVPLNVQRINVLIDRPGFMLAPTSCAAKRIAATLISTGGLTARPTARFQVGECSRLGFSPKLAFRFTGANQVRTGGHPAFKSVLTQPAKQANIAGVKVTLPKSIALDPNNSTDPRLVCGYDEGLKADCPASSIIGRATAISPVLGKPLSGNVHLVQGIRFGPTGNRIRTTPALLIKLRGEVAIDVRAKTTVRNGLLVTTLPDVPDAPVTRFDLTINGGKNKGILVVTRTRQAKLNLCNTKQTANNRLTAQNGKQADFDTAVKTPCANAAKKAKRSKKK